MRFFRKHIALIGFIWLLTITSMDMIIPLHFFVTEHQASCDVQKNGCCPGEQKTCPICAFDLFIGYQQGFSFNLNRVDVLLYSSRVLKVQYGDFTYNNFVSLRGPPLYAL